jgi:choice-of-anchor A domain-containing protein
MKKFLSILSGLFLFASLNTSASDFLLNEYSVVTIENFTSGSGTHVAGNTFVGGDYSTTGKSDLGQQNSPLTSGTNVLTVAGEMNANVSTFNKDILLSSANNTVTAGQNSNQVNINGTQLSDIGTVNLSNSLDAIKADYKAQLENSSQYFASLESNSSLVTTNEGKKKTLTVNNTLGANDVAVFSLDGFTNIFNAQNQSLSLTGSNINDLSAIIINVSGNDLSIINSANLNGNMNRAEISSKIIWNFYEATTIKLNSQKFVGALLAPYAAVTQNGGNIYGSVGALSLITNAEINVPTDVNITTPPLGVGSATSVPEPTTLILMFIAMAGLLYKRKTLNV